MALIPETTIVSKNINSVAKRTKLSGYRRCCLLYSAVDKKGREKLVAQKNRWDYICESLKNAGKILPRQKICPRDRDGRKKRGKRETHRKNRTTPLTNGAPVEKSKRSVCAPRGGEDRLTRRIYTAESKGKLN